MSTMYIVIFLFCFFPAHIESCGPLDVLACAGVVAGCGAVCAAAEIDLPACIACCGGSYSTCKGCF